MGLGEQLLQAQGQAGLTGIQGFFFPQGKSQATQFKWLGKRDREGEDGCRGAGLALCPGQGSVGTGEGWELPRASQAHLTLLPKAGWGHQ